MDLFHMLGNDVLAPELSLKIEVSLVVKLISDDHHYILFCLGSLTILSIVPGCLHQTGSCVQRCVKSLEPASFLPMRFLSV